MEFVGKIVSKEFKGFGVFEGVVESYDSLTGFFKILYEDGDSEEADLSEVTRLISSSSSVAAVNSIAGNQKVETRKVGRKPKKRRRNVPGKSSDNLEVDNSQQNLVIESELGRTAVNDCNVSVNVNGNLDGIDGNDGLDLNRGLNVDDGVQNGEVRGGIDLNLSVDDDGFDGDDTRIEKVGLVERIERGFDLNLGIEDEGVNGENGTININSCVGLGEEVKDGDVSAVDANLVNSRVCDYQLDGGGVEAVTPNQCQDGNSGRRKRRKMQKNLSTPTETVLRRSSRRTKVAAVNENDASSAVVEDEVNDMSVVSGVIDEAEEKPAPQVLERIIEPQTPPKIELPPSSANLNLEGIPVLDIFSVYACLRSFSTKLYLSPFELEDLVAALKSRVSNQLIDLIHVAILQTLRTHLELLASEGCESASICLRNLNWDFLDAITWPVFMVEYLLIHGSGLKSGFSLNHLKLFEGEYYKNPAEVKIELLRCLCDDVVEVEAIRSELSKRTGIAEANMDTGRMVCNDRKRRTSLDVPVDSCPSEGMKEEVADGNSDECCLCKMDGNLICCDGCPAAYHSKCVGIVSSLLPEGNWYCPECVIGKLKFADKPQKYIRGAELLGTDTCGRLFFSCFDYLLVSDSSDAEAVCSYYHKDDLSDVIQLLQSSTILYSSILSAISQHWAFPTEYDGRKSKKITNTRYSGHSGSEISEPADLFGSDTAKTCRETTNLLTSSEGSGEVLQENELIKKSCRSVPNMAARGTSGKKLSSSKLRKKKGPARKGRSVLKAKEEDVLQEQSGDNYLNNYSFARTAFSVVEELLRKPTGKDAPKTEEEIISIQLKFILKKSVKSCWTTIQDLNRKRQIEKCGWCYCCRFPVEGRGCLFSNLNGISVSDALKEEIDGILSKRNKKGHLVDVICYILCMEERLRGLLSGPWLRPQYSELWRQRVLKACDVFSLKLPLLTLEANVRPLAISADWWKHVDLVTTMGSASHFVASSRATSKNGLSRKKNRYADSENKSSTAGRGLVFFWWRGGKTSRSLFNWKGIPRSLALKVARKAGCMKLPDIQYPDASEIARRTKCVAWRAAVETSTSLEQLALQVREFDLVIRWDDIENTHSHSLLDKNSIKSIRLFKKVIIRRKCSEGTVARYLLDFGKRRSVPDVVLKHGQKFEKSDCERKKYWLDEVYVPLYLLKSFEEKRITRKAGKKNYNKFRKGVKVCKKPSREKGFDYLFSRAERVDSYQCGHCNKNVLISEAVSCQLCNGYFHKRHVMKSSEGITSECSYTCHKCWAGKHVKKESNLGKQKIGKLRAAKNVKVVSEGHSAALRAKPRKKGRPLGSRRKVLLRNAKKMLSHEQSPSQKITNVSTGVTLRRSARKTNNSTLHSNSSARKAICTTLHTNSSAGGKKRKRNKRRNLASKKTPKGISWQKKRTQILHSFWINGLMLSRKPNDERVIQFKRRKLLAPSEVSAEIDDQPKCSLCSQQGSTSASMYISCEICGDWFHGDAFGLNKGNIDSLIGFKCHVCRDRSPPACPFVDKSRDVRMLFMEAACDAQESSEVVAVRKDTDNVLELQCNDNSSGILEAHLAQNCDKNLNQVKTLILDSELRVVNGSPACKEAVSCSEDNSTLFIEASIEAPDAQRLREAVATQKATDCVLELQQKCDGTCDQYDTPMLVSEARVGNGSLGKEAVSCSEDNSTLFTEASIEDPDAKGLREVVAIQMATDCVLELQQKCDGTHDQYDTLMLDSETRVENRSLGNDIASSSGDVSTLFIESSSEAPDEVVAVRKETDCVLDFHCNGGSSSVVEVHAAQNCDGNQDQGETPMLDSELKKVNGSPTSNEVVCCSKDNNSLFIESVSAALDPQVIGVQCNEGSSGVVEIDSAHNCDGNLDQNDTLMLGSELRVENGSPTSNEVASYSGEVKPLFNESSSKALDAPGLPGVVIHKKTDCAQQLQCTEGSSEVHSAPSCDGNLRQVETLIVDPEVGVVNGILTSKEVVSCSIESQDLDTESKLLRESDENCILERKQ
ncbi:DDT domain-containing protein PTM-like [Chenopodium quinoa]|uniref:DDT domain-containing protein PTM-like n=1 Tax=Chenopodium quinoa TaxID=63459 RepID=UPI000B77B6E5|nr:DDT domain-containing protein PTM-like [Chenopodium quinoa]